MALRTIRGFNGLVLPEEALILLAMLVATGLLALGIAELAWPSTPRRSARHMRPAAAPRPEPPALPLRDDEWTPVTAEPTPPDERRAGRAVGEPPETEPGTRATAAMPPEVAEPTPNEAARLLDEPIVHARSAEPPAPRSGPRPQVLPVDTCLAMYRERRFTDVVSLGSAALEVHARLAAVSDRPHEAAALLDLVGLSKQELGDRDGAREAFRRAIRDAEAAIRPTYVGHLVALVQSVTESAPDPVDDKAAVPRVRELQATARALADAVATTPADDALLGAQTVVREALSSACEPLVGRMVAGEADEETRAVVLEILGDEAMPSAWRERLREQLSAASSAEIGQLTAQAIRSVQDGKDADALEALERAKRLAAALPSGGVADERHEEFQRRLWWGYTKVGLRRVETRNFESALEPLFRALELGGVDEERVAETRSALVRALDGIVDARAAAIQQLGGDPAQAEIRRLSALLRGATEHGLRQEDVADVVAKLSELEQGLTGTSQP